jgi:hypothetical protein
MFHVERSIHSQSHTHVRNVQNYKFPRSPQRPNPSTFHVEPEFSVAGSFSVPVPRRVPRGTYPLYTIHVLKRRACVRQTFPSRKTTKFTTFQFSANITQKHIYLRILSIYEFYLFTNFIYYMNFIL